MATAFASATAFRAWLRRHHATAGELVVRFSKAHVRPRGLTYGEALDEALCFGWIDGLRRRIDQDTFLIRFTPRKSTSIWSRVNVAHAQRLLAAKRMMPAGRKAFEARTDARTGVYSFERAAMAFSPAAARQFRGDRVAWAYFRQEAPWYRRASTYWVMSAKREETRLRRLEILIRASRAGTRIPALSRPGDGGPSARA